MKVYTFRFGILHTNCHIIINEHDKIAAVVDPSGNPQKIIEKVSEKGCKIKYILLTHGHFDHIFALEELRARTGAPVAIHTEDADCVTDPEVSYMKQFAGLDLCGKDAEIILTGGDTLEFGKDVIEVIHTPGHSRGSVSYKIGDNIFTGDTLFLGGIGRYDLRGGCYEDIIDSLKKLASLPGDYNIYPGHGGKSSLDNERKNNIYLR